LTPPGMLSCARCMSADEVFRCMVSLFIALLLDEGVRG
jgi:hypothetical protein